VNITPPSPPELKAVLGQIFLAPVRVASLGGSASRSSEIWSGDAHPYSTQFFVLPDLQFAPAGRRQLFAGRLAARSDLKKQTAEWSRGETAAWEICKAGKKNGRRQHEKGGFRCFGAGFQYSTI
jgi:hypothetical protein